MNHRYLDTRVTTASQPELQLMLLDGALRFARQAHQIWGDDDQRSEAGRLVTRAIEILEEMILGVVNGKAPESKRLEEEYIYIFRQLSSALLKHDIAALDEAIKLLDFERETWRLACEKVRGQATPTPASFPAPTPTTGNAQLPASGFSFQA
jgi:flagellar protein FliS